MPIDSCIHHGSKRDPFRGTLTRSGLAKASFSPSPVAPVDLTPYCTLMFLVDLARSRPDEFELYAANIGDSKAFAVSNGEKLTGLLIRAGYVSKLSSSSVSLRWFRLELPHCAPNCSKEIALTEKSQVNLTYLPSFHQPQYVGATRAMHTTSMTADMTKNWYSVLYTL